MFYIKGIAVLDNNLRGREMEGISVVANARTVVDYVCREWVDEVFIDIPEEKNYPHELIDQFAEMGVVVHVPLKRMSGLKRSKQLVEKLKLYSPYNQYQHGYTVAAVDKKSDGHTGRNCRVCDNSCFVYFYRTSTLESVSRTYFFKQIRIGKNGKSLSYINSEACIWMPRNEKRTFWQKIRCQMI